MVSWCRVRDWHVDVNELSSAFLSTSTALMSPHVKRRGSSLRSRSSSSLSITSQCVGVAVSVCANVPLFFSVSLALPLSLSPSPQGPCINAGSEIVNCSERFSVRVLHFEPYKLYVHSTFSMYEILWTPNYSVNTFFYLISLTKHITKTYVLSYPSIDPNPNFFFYFFQFKEEFICEFVWDYLPI